MKKYISFFRMRFLAGLQYRAASFAGLVTQVLWGCMECLAFSAIYDSNPAAFPMEYTAMMSYIWLKEAFFVLFTVWQTDNDIFSMILNGGIAYEFCRPVSLYRMWFARTAGGRAASAAMRFGPILLIAFSLPWDYRLLPPQTPVHLLLFLFTMLLGLIVTVCFCMLIYILCFFTLSPAGVRMLLMSVVEFCSGAIIPLPFIPQPLRSIMELLPFASMQNVPFRVYSGDLWGNSLCKSIMLQIFWIFFLLLLGHWLFEKARKRIIVQGG